MRVSTHSARVLEARRACIELLLSDHLGECVGPCTTSCPAGIDIPGFVSHLAKGENQAALRLIKHDMPLPGVLGRICDRPCETSCRRSLVEDPIAICQLKRFAADRAVEAGDNHIPERVPPTGQRVAIVGAGPAGLTAAYYLQILGHCCTVFDAHPAAGGMVRYGAPSYRLPRSVIEQEVAVIEALGTRFELGVRLGTDVHLAQLRRDFDAVFIAIGAQNGRNLGVEGQDAEGLFSAVDFLHDNNSDNRQISMAGHVVLVVGGGDVAIDAARVALRRGATEVHVHCLESRQQMPATEAHHALEEGVHLHTQSGVSEIVATEGRVSGLLTQRCTRVFDEAGHFSPVYEQGTLTTVKGSRIIVAVGQSVDTEVAPTQPWETSGVLCADAHTLQTPVTGVFAGGDCTIGPRTAVNAVSDGRRAAIAIDQFLGGESVVGDQRTYNHSMGSLADSPKQLIASIVKDRRAPTSLLSMAERLKGSGEVEMGLSPEAAQAEARRCLECGCRDAPACQLRSHATALHASQERFAGKASRSFERNDAHPTALFEAHKCIHCRRCVRLSEALLGAPLLDIVGRGMAARVRPPASPDAWATANTQVVERLIDCCPVGALTRKNDPIQAVSPIFIRPRGEM